jgi:hypothetical protein
MRSAFAESAKSLRVVAGEPVSAIVSICSVSDAFSAEVDRDHHTTRQ